MSATPLFRTNALLLGVCYLLCTSTVWAQVPAPRFNVGDWWVFERVEPPDTRTRFKETIKAIHDDHIAIVLGKGGKRRFSLAMLPTDATQSEIQLLRFPLEVGKKWEAKFDWKNGSVYGTNSMKYEVVAKEEVEVPAGKFEAYKVSGFGWVEDKATNWGSVGGQPKQIETYWYAPAVKRIIKYDNKNLKWIPPQFIETYSKKYELASYRLQ